MVTSEYKVVDIDGEEWGIVRGFEGYYEVSNCGRVKSLPRQSGFYYNNDEKLLRGFIKSNGYVAVDLYCRNGKIKKYVHRLVAEAFIYNEYPELRTEINHKDENKQNNHVSNLEWCTSSENKQHGTYRQRIIKSNTNNPKKSTPVVQMSIDGTLIKIYKSIKDVERQTGLFASSITRTCKGKTKTCGGYRWCYLSEWGGKDTRSEQAN